MYRGLSVHRGSDVCIGGLTVHRGSDVCIGGLTVHRGPDVCTGGLIVHRGSDVSIGGVMCVSGVWLVYMESGVCVLVASREYLASAI